MNDLGGKHCRHRDEDEDEQPVVGAPALGHRHDRKPGERGLLGHALSDEILGDGRNGVDDEPGKNAGKEAEAQQYRHCGEREEIRLQGIGRSDRSRPAEERYAVGPHEAGCRKGRAKREHRAGGRHQELQSPLRGDRD